MYGHNTTSDHSAHLFHHFPSLPEVTATPLALPSAPLILPPPPPLVIPGNEFHSMPALKWEVNYSSSGCSSNGSSSSLVSYSTRQSSLIQRSLSSHSLQKNRFRGQLVSSPTEFVDSETSPVRRVFSTGDLQERINMVQHFHRSESSLSNEISIIESMNKACRYSPEEKKERIERYRSKRNQRNFNKKIKYACRKTLADSRPRIRGRFARNDEIEKSSPHQWSQVSGEEDDEEDDNWINFIDAFSANLIP
uniref:Putative histone-lysine N-methyltransferase set-2 n=1 Tax=Davidia involucrata TaxID=16924 RepID=A0A5B6YLN5_DAVIN